MVKHTPVLLDESLDAFEPKAKQRFLDCTFGGGGHTRALLAAEDGIEVTAMDCDPDAVSRAEPLKMDFGRKFRFVDANFSRLNEFAYGPYDGVLFDLGLSSFQLGEASRGFSFRLDAPIDMRFDSRVGVSASEFLESASEGSLIRAVREYGEERRWKRVVDAILGARGTGALARTKSAAKLIETSIGGRRTRIHPATKTFQGIRIAINGEMESLALALPQAFGQLRVGGILVVISFHSLEDRITKRFFRRMAGRPEHRGDSSVSQDRRSYGTMIKTKAVKPSAAEIERNPRSRSARLRAIRKLSEPQL
ncbi:MAG: 16S rRNA (cytosine(1402)-N(4))-methyltransferase RsmH [Opitutales bacterium]